MIYLLAVIYCLSVFLSNVIASGWSALLDAALEPAEQSDYAKPDGNQQPGSFLIHGLFSIP